MSSPPRTRHEAIVQRRIWGPGDEYAVVEVQVSEFEPGERVQVVVHRSPVNGELDAGRVGSNHPDAGRELDALVAEKVMGWTQTRVGIREQLRFHPQDGESPTGAYPVDVGPGEEWSPSTDIAAAWQVIEHTKVLASDYRNGLDSGLTLHQNRDGQWEIRYRHGVAIATADTAPHAICLAALQIVERL